ncbi:MAG: hypothetical protein U0271_35450 [Polyangiaceae bacterium]
MSGRSGGASAALADALAVGISVVGEGGALEAEGSLVGVGPTSFEEAASARSGSWLRAVHPAMPVIISSAHAPTSAEGSCAARFAMAAFYRGALGSAGFRIDRPGFVRRTS